MSLRSIIFLLYLAGPCELNSNAIFMRFSCSALRQTQFINSATCLSRLPLSPLHCDKKCSPFNASIHSPTNKHYVWNSLSAYSIRVCSYAVCVLCVFSFRARNKNLPVCVLFTWQRHSAVWLMHPGLSLPDVRSIFYSSVWCAIDSLLT